MSEPSESKLLLKLVAAAKAIDHVEKDKRNDFHKYDYSSIEAVVRAVRGELLKRKVLVVAGAAGVEERQRPTREGESTITTAHLTFTFMDAETGEKLEIPWFGRGDDPADKGLAKAITDARKNFLIVQLNLPRGDDIEADEATDSRNAHTVNMLDEARGLSNSQLNNILVAAGLAAQQAPYGFFARIPTEYATGIRAQLDRAKNGVAAT